ncbi:golgin subfamily A member 6-like protein 22 isoform X2 [Mercenaria mercenaria]|uniref:golgin subfamily A member 6-like protein 22 isoform X2 n=1 Tax=Mercenaria mercenaria TaxID=6596 RepID=UPI00234F7C9D|nr:golgin subfamily A member 6-like protein 22 isoform X2 [Mercenaria mercenaria]
MSSLDTVYDCVADVLQKLKSGRHPSVTVVDKAMVQHGKLMDDMKRYQEELNEKGKIGVFLATNVCKVNKTNEDSDKVAEEDLDRNGLYKMMEASARNCAESSKLKEELTSAKSEIENLTKQVNELAEKANTERQARALEESLQELRNANKRLKSENTDLNRALESAKSGAETPSKQVDWLVHKENDRDIHTDLIRHSLTEENERLRSENVHLHGELKSAGDKLQRYSNEVKELAQKVETSRYNDFDKKEVVELREANKTLRSDIRELAQEIEFLKRDLDQQRKQTEEAHRNATHFKKEIHNMSRVNERLNSNIVRVESELQRANDQMHTLKERRKVEKQNATKHIEEAHYMNKQNEILSRDNNWLERELKATKDKMQRLMEGRKQDDQNTRASSKDVYTVNQDKGGQSSENIWLERELKATKDKLQRVEEERNREKQNTARSRQEVYSINHENERLRSKNIGLKSELNRTKDEMQRLLEGKNKVEQKDINRRPDTDNPRTHEKQKEQIIHLSNENKKLQDQLHETRNRLSALAGHKMTADNPNIADLSDAYRPTNIAEQFREVYDNEWTHAYEELDIQNPEEETKIIDTLVTILKNIEVFCMDVSSQQFDTLKAAIVNEVTYPKYKHKSGTVMAGKHRAEMSSAQTELADKLLKDLRKSLGILSTGPLAQIFHTVYMTQHRGADDVCPAGINAFVVQSVKLVWMMKMQTPPMGFIWAKVNQNVDKNKFTFYTKRGDVTKQCVWPAIELHKNGPLMSKGIVQAM